MKTISIAGAGLAGMTAGINLARAGLDVEIIEMRSDAGARFHGDFQFFENWSRDENVLDTLRGFNLDLGFPIWPVYAGTAFDERRGRHPLRSERPVMYRVRRGAFEGCLDAGLKRQAVASGVRIRPRTRADATRADIVATGPEPSTALVYVRGVVFDTDLVDDVRVLLDPVIAPGVYAYLVAHEGKAVVCAAYTKRHHYKKTGRDFVEDAVAVLRDTGFFDVRNARYFSSFCVSPLITRDPRIIVGEAAGFQDAGWGFGMRMAVQSGYHAARAIIESDDYWDRVGKEIVPLVMSTAVNRLLLDFFGRRTVRLLLGVLDRSQDRAHVLRRCYHPYGWKGLVITIARSHCRKRQIQKPSR